MVLVVAYGEVELGRLGLSEHRLHGFRGLGGDGVAPELLGKRAQGAVRPAAAAAVAATAATAIVVGRVAVGP